MENKVKTVELSLRGKRLAIGLNNRELPVSPGDRVVVELDKGQAIAKVMKSCDGCDKGCGSKPVGRDGGKPTYPLLRLANYDDKQKDDANREKEALAFPQCKAEIKKHDLAMKLVDVEYQFGGGKITFYFTADRRVDFRELVKALASLFRTRIELRQIGVRDAAKLIDGVGICGKQQCCSGFMREFHQISTQMAKDQQLSLNPSKISGNCGRLLCCLQFEEDDYIEAYKRLPRSGSRFTDESGKYGDVVFVDTFQDRIHVRRWEKGMNQFQWYTMDEIAKGKIDERQD